MIENKVREAVKKLKPYVPGKSKEEIARNYGISPRDIIKLGSNENPWGSSPKIKNEILNNGSNKFNEIDCLLSDDDNFYVPYETEEKILSTNENDLIKTEKIINVLTDFVRTRKIDIKAAFFIIKNLLKKM